MSSTKFDTIIGQFSDITQKPVNFLSVQSEVKKDVQNLVISIYDFTKSQEEVTKKKKKGSLAELIVEDFDEEQIWQQIELQNSQKWDQLVWEVANSMSAKTDLQFPVIVKESAEADDDEDELSTAEDEDLSQSDEETTELPKNKNKSKPQPAEDVESEEKDTRPRFEKKKKPKGKSSIVDDDFFKLQDMEKFLLNEEKKEGGKMKEADSDEESIDMFDDMDDEGEGSDDEEGGRDVKYYDFFERGDDDEGGQENDDDENEYDDDLEDEEDNQPPKPVEKGKKKVTFAGMSESDDNSTDNEAVDTNKEDKTENKNEKKSQFELRQERLKNQIEKLENKVLTDAPWQLKGEVDATKRPQNSLLQEVVDFDLTARPAPIITEQTTVTLEDIIRQRVKDKAWDDVVKKEKPVDDQLSFRKTEVLDHSKSKLSLAQVYEAEYLKQKQAASGEVEEEKEPEAHTEIRDSMSKLFAKLDALCHYHYTPRAPQADVKIISNTPAISMEEVAPVATSDATLLAPEEVKKKRRGELMSKEERTQTDKNRERRKKKDLQRKKGNVMKVTEHRNTQKAVETSNDKTLKTSKAFFQQLNDDATSLIKSNKSKRNVKNKGQ